MPTRPLLSALALAFGLALATAADAEPILLNANLTYAANAGWSFDAGSVNGRILIDRPTSRKLAKLDQFTVHLCNIMYEPDSKIEASNGDFYTLLRIGKCN
jgi:hypothetical protein